MVIGRRLRNVTGQLCHLDFRDQVALARGPQNLALTGFEPVHHVGQRPQVICIGEMDEFVIDEAGVTDIGSSCRYIDDTVAVIGCQPLLAVIGALLVEG